MSPRAGIGARGRSARGPQATLIRRTPFAVGGAGPAGTARRASVGCHVLRGHQVTVAPYRPGRHALGQWCLEVPRRRCGRQRGLPARSRCCAPRRSPPALRAHDALSAVPLQGPCPPGPSPFERRRALCGRTPSTSTRCGRAPTRSPHARLHSFTPRTPTTALPARGDHRRLAARGRPARLRIELRFMRT